MDENDDASIDRLRSGYDSLATNADELSADASPWGDSDFQRYYSWPATRSVLPDVEDCRVLLAGCGRGDHVPWFRDRGATVVGVDASEVAIRLARQRFGDEATFHRADLTRPLHALSSDGFDLVVSNLVMSHVEFWTPVFEEFRRVLDPPGSLVVTTVHPQYLLSETGVDRYYAATTVMNDWPGVEIPTFYRPVDAAIGSFLDAGFRLASVDEPEPQERYAELQPERYRKALRRPALLVIRATVDESVPGSS